MKCGENGGRTPTGRPCGRPVKGGLCTQHQGDPAGELAARKAKFIAIYETAEVSMAAAARQIGVDRITVWKWRKEDPVFDERVTTLVQSVDEQRVQMVEETLFARIVKGEASPAETIFWLVNRAGGRWRHVQHVEHSGPNGGAVEVSVTRQIVPATRIAAAKPAGNGRHRANGNARH